MSTDDQIIHVANIIKTKIRVTESSFLSCPSDFDEIKLEDIRVQKIIRNIP